MSGEVESLICLCLGECVVEVGDRWRSVSVHGEWLTSGPQEVIVE